MSDSMDFVTECPVCHMTCTSNVPCRCGHVNTTPAAPPVTDSGREDVSYLCTCENVAGFCPPYEGGSPCEDCVAHVPQTALTAERERLREGDEFIRAMKAWSEWSNATFGTERERGPAGPLHHLLREVKEAIDAPDDPMEYVDMLALVMDSARRAGFDAATILTLSWVKLEINKEREWGKRQADGTIEHVRAALKGDDERAALTAEVERLREMIDYIRMNESDDTAERLVCNKAGELGHQQCGWCDEHDTARMSCGCLAVMEGDSDG